MRMRKKCPICGKAADQGASWSPFCGSRCRTQDLANWASSLYAVPDSANEADEHLKPPVPADGSGHCRAGARHCHGAEATETLCRNIF